MQNAPTAFDTENQVLIRIPSALAEIETGILTSTLIAKNLELGEKFVRSSPTANL